MDLLNIKPATQKVEILHPGTGERTGLVLEVTSMEADAVKRVNRRQMDKALRSRAKKMTAAEIEANATERLSAAVVGWEVTGTANLGGQKMDFTPENVATVMALDWLRRQVEEAIGDDAAFFS